MSGALPVQIHPFDLARGQTRLEGQYRLAELPRLSDREGTDAPVELDLRYTLIEGTPFVRMQGKVRLNLPAICQRCLEPMELALAIDIDLAIGRPGDEARAEAIEQELLVIEGPVVLKDLIEDEILLALPMMPMHDPGECRASEHLERLEQDDTGRADNPFAQLAKLKKGGQ